METANTIDIVIPVYNEGDKILKVLDAFQEKIHSQIRVLVCYDYDEDNTLTAIAKKSYPFEIVQVKNKGKFAHGAVVTGFYYDDSPAVISYMADDDYNADVIDRMIESYYHGADVVAGSRFIPGGCMQGCRWQKALPVRMVSFTLYYLARLPVHDATNAFRLFSRKLLNQVEIESSEGFTYSLELLVKCHRLGWKIVEIPVKWFERTNGSSRFKILNWAGAYLRWYFYAFGTAFIQKSTQ